MRERERERERDGKILFWSLNFTKNLFFIPKHSKVLFSSLNFVNIFLIF